jgi:hypothetical protein
MVRESILDETWNDSRVGMLALIRPVITSTGALRRQNQVDAGCPRLLCQAGNLLLDLLAGDHHQVSQFVDDDHDMKGMVFSGSGVSGVSG